MPLDISTPVYWERPDRLHSIFRDVERNRAQRTLARQQATPAAAQRATEITAIFPFMKPGVVQGLTKSGADDNMVIETAKLAAQQAQQDGRYDDPRSLKHLPYRSRKPKPRVEVPSALGGDLFSSLNQRKEQSKRDKMLRREPQDGIMGVMDQARAAQQQNPSLAQQIGPPSQGPSNMSPQLQNIIGQETQIEKARSGQASLRPDDLGAEYRRQQNREVPQNFLEAQSLPPGTSDHSRVGNVPSGPVEGLKQGARTILTGVSSGIEATSALASAGMTSYQKPNVGFGEALRENSLPLAMYASMPAILDRIKEGDLSREDVENKNWFNLYTSLLRDPISQGELDQYLTEDGENIIPYGEEARAWTARKEQAKQFAEAHYPDIADAYRDEDDPYQVFASPGRIFAREFTNPGDRTFDLLSGLADLTFNIAADPLAVASGGASRLARAQKTFGANQSALKALYPKIGDFVESLGGFVGKKKTPVGAAEHATEFLTRDNHGRAVSQWLTETSGPGAPHEIWRGFGKKMDFNTAVELADAQDVNRVNQIFIDAVQGKSTATGQNLGRRIREAPGPRGMLTGPISRSFADLTTTGNAGRALGFSATLKSRGNPIRFFARAPMVGGIDVADNVNRGLENFERNLVNAKLPLEKISNLVSRFMRAPGQVERQRVVFEGFAEIGTRISGIQRKVIPDNATQSQIDEINKFNTRVDEFAHRLTRVFGEEFEKMRLYSIDSQTGMPAKFAGARNEYDEAMAVGGMMAEVMNKKIPNPDWRRIRQQTSGIRHVLQNKTPESIGHNAWNSLVGVGEKTFVRLWQPLQLFRAAWLARVTLEEVAGRMSVNGLSGMGNHPATYVASVLGGLPSEIGRVTGPISAVRAGARGVGNKFGRYRNTAGMGKHFGDEQFSDSKLADKMAEGLNQKNNAWLHRSGDPENPTSVVGIKLMKDRGGVNRAGVDAWANILHRMRNDGPMQKLAGGVNEDDFASIAQTRPDLVDQGFETVEELWWNGTLSNGRAQLARASGPRPLSPSEKAHYGYEKFDEALINSRKFAHDFLRGNTDSRLIETTGADPELLDLIRTGRFTVTHKGQEYVMDIGNIQPMRKGRHGAAWRQFKDFLTDKAEEMGDTAPRLVPGTDDMVNREQKLQVGQRMDDFMDSVMEFGFIKPNDMLARSPTLRQFNWQSAEEWLPFATRNVQESVLQNAKTARVPRQQRNRLHRIVENGAGDTIIDQQTFDNVTMNDAVEWTKDMLYDVADRGQYADIMRITNPFLEAFREVYKHWGVILSRNPRYIQRMQQGLKAQKGAGTIYEDERTGQDMFVMPGINAASNLALDMVNSKVGAETMIKHAGRVSGLNLIAQTIAPSFGPAVTLPASALPDAITHRYKFIKEVLFPFGEDDSIENAFLPAWMQNFYSFLRNDPDSYSVHRSTKGRVEQMLASTGEYTLDRHGMVSEAEAEEFERDADKLTSWLMIIRGFQQFALPTGPEFRFEVKNPRDGALHGIGALGEEMQELQEENDGDWEAATELFIDKFGWDFLGAIMPRSQSPSSASLDTTEQLDWGLKNPEFVESHSNVAGYFAPNPDSEDWDLEAYFENSFGPEARELTGAQRVLLRNNIIGHTILRQEEERAKTMYPDDENKQQRYISEYKGIIMNDYPGFGQTVAGTLDRPDIQDQVKEIRRALDHPSLPQGNKVVEATQEYFKLRDRMDEIAIERGGAGRDSGSLLRSKDMVHARDELEMFGRFLVEEVPEFAAIFNSVLLPELDIMSPEDRESRGIREEVDPSRIPGITEEQLQEDEGDQIPTGPISPEQAAPRTVID